MLIVLTGCAGEKRENESSKTLEVSYNESDQKTELGAYSLHIEGDQSRSFLGYAIHIE